jgi:hypothetical protein
MGVMGETQVSGIAARRSSEAICSIEKKLQMFEKATSIPHMSTIGLQESPLEIAKAGNPLTYK